MNFIAFLCLFLGQQDKVPKDAPKAVILPAAPTTPPVGAPVKIAADQVYAFRATVKCVIIASPQGIVKIQGDQGPIRAFAKFSPDSGYEFKSFTEKYVWFITPQAKGVCELIIVPEGLDESKVVRLMLDVMGPRPPPPIPPDQDQDPIPVPPKADKLTLVVVWESADSTPAIAKVLQDLDYWHGLRTQGHKWFKIDKDQKNAAGQLIVDANKYTPYIQQRGLPLLLIMGQDGTFFESLRLPATTAEITERVEKWTGK